MRVAAALAVILSTISAQAHQIDKASPGCTAWAMASFAHGEYLIYKGGGNLTHHENLINYVMWRAVKADQTQGENWCWGNLAEIFENK